LVDHTNKEKWVWKDKMEQWARYVLPIPAKGPSQFDSVDDAAQESVSETYVQPPVELGLPIERRHDGAHSEGVRWSANHTITTTAVFGHLLHPHTSPDLLPSLADLIDSSDRPRIFSPVVPHPMRLAQLNSNPIEFFPITSTILVRLVPRPVKESTTRAPVLELRLGITESLYHWRGKPEVSGVHSLRAVTEAQRNDVLHPYHPVDLRITQTRTCALQGDALNEWQPIADFLSKARLDLDGGKLEMPPQQRFLVPTRLFTPGDQDKKSAAKRSSRRKKNPTQEELDDDEMQAILDEVDKGTADPDHLHATPYEFAGLELHRAVSVPHPTDSRFELTYTSIEAGQGGGRRAELSLGLRAGSTVPPSSSCAPATASAEVSDLSDNADTASTPTDAALSQTSGTTTQEPPPVSQDDYLRACYEFVQTAENWSGYSSSAAGQSTASN
jgi:hypothetical protein